MRHSNSRINNTGAALWRALVWSLVVCLAPLMACRADIDPAAEASVRGAIESLLARLKSEGPAIKQDTARIDTLARELVLPHFDFAQMSQRALGRHWPSFTPAQRTRFIAAFQTLMIRTYSRAIADYSDASVKYEPARELNPGVLKIRTEVQKPDGGKLLKLDFVVRRQESAWRAIDVTLNGVSLVVSYRAGFDADIGTAGVDGLIQQLETRNTGG